METLHSSNKEEKISLINTISATQLGFSYDGERSILKNCDFELSSPSCLAIYGPSGSGKSTLGLILTNFMRPTSGRILVNGKNMNSVAKKSLNQKLGYVSPNDYFFEDSIINNLRIVAPDVSREYVLQLADELNLTEWLSSLDDGLDTIIGSQGLNISSGQQARLSVLRAALRNISVVLLDEITAPMDQENKLRTVSFVKNHFSDAITIFITHDLVLSSQVDTVFEMVDGCLVERKQ